MTENPTQLTACGPECDRQHAEFESHNTNLARPVVVTPAPESRLEQLHAAYAEAKAQADEAAKRLKGITDAIKAELTAQHPGAPRLTLQSNAGPALGLTYSESWRVDAKRLKAENPLVYVTYAVKSGSWRLAPVRGGGED